MEERKHPGRFTLQFNMEDPRQRDAADLLRQQGRRKAQFLTSAILSYAGCHDGSEQGIRPPAVDMETLKRMVSSILRDGSQPSDGNHIAVNRGESELQAGEDDVPDGAFSAMANTLAAFRRK